MGGAGPKNSSINQTAPVVDQSQLKSEKQPTDQRRKKAHAMPSAVHCGAFPASQWKQDDIDGSPHREAECCRCHRSNPRPHPVRSSHAGKSKRNKNEPESCAKRRLPNEAFSKRASEQRFPAAKTAGDAP